MKYKTIGTGLGRDSRNDINKNFEDIDFDIKNVIANSENNKTSVAQALLDAENAKTKAEEAKTTADGISAIANDAKAKAVAAETNSLTAKTTAETVRGEFDQVIAEAGSNNPEVVQARGTYTNLNQRLDSTAQQLAETLDEEFYPELIKRIPTTATMTIIDDDAHAMVYEKLKPIIQSYPNKITCAVVTGRVGVNPLTLTEAQVSELAGLGMEMVSHTHSHAYLANLTTEEIISELKLSREWLMKRGYNGNHIVYPYGSVNATVFKETKKVFKTGIDVVEGINTPPLAMHRLLRHDLDVSDLQTAKQKIDEVAINGGWLIWKMHCHYAQWTPEKLAEIEALIDYAESKGVEVANVATGYRKHGNMVEIGDTLTKGKSTVIDSKGDVHSDVLGKYRMTLIHTFNGNTPIAEFDKHAITEVYLNSTQASGNIPENSAGVLITHRIANDLYSFQEYHLISKNKVYKRRWVADQWTTWEDTSSMNLKYLPNNAITSDTSTSSFDTTAITYNIVNGSAMATMPESSEGVLMTNAYFKGKYIYQEFVTVKGKRYSRYYTGSTWSGWRRTDFGAVAKDLSLSVGVIAANASKDISVNSSAFTIEDSILGNPTTLPVGIVYNCWISAAGVATLRLTNLTGEPIDCGLMDWKFKSLSLL